MITETDRLKMINRLEVLEHKGSRIDELVKGGFISKRFGDYAKQISMIDFAVEEAEIHAKYGDIGRVGKILADVKIALDTIATLYLQPLFERNPEAFFRGEFGDYKELIDYARQKFDDGLIRCENLLERSVA